MKPSTAPNATETLSVSSPSALRRALILGVLAGACSGQQPTVFEGRFPMAQSYESGVLSSKSAILQAPLQQTIEANSILPPPELRVCPRGMVSINDEYCIDRYEASLVDVEGERRVSPYYYPGHTESKRVEYYWSTLYQRFGTVRGRQTPLPELPVWEKEEPFSVEARSVGGVVPNGYMTAIKAEEACENAGKRLCTVQEWRKACKGVLQTKYPYGLKYEPGKCNYARSPHPAQLLQGDGQEYRLTDPRLSLMKIKGEPFLYTTGSVASCASQWNEDAAYDMVGNLSEWARKGDDYAIMGGYYGRHRTQLGCEGGITQHAPQYYDYSIGTRCCSDTEHSAD